MKRPQPPLENWWWYLDCVAANTYPAELLPPHLRKVVDYAWKSQEMGRIRNNS